MKQQQYILITGTSSGLGLHLAYMAKGIGFSVLSVNRSNMAGQNNWKNYLCDLESQENVNEITTALVEDTSTFDKLVIVLNAGQLGAPTGFSTSFENLHNLMAVNCFSQLYIVETLCSKRPSLKIELWCVSSGWGSISVPADTKYAGYACSKVCLAAGARILEKTFSNLKIAVIDPGWMRTKLGGNDAPIEPRQSAEQFLKLIRRGVDSLVQKETGTVNLFNGFACAW